MNEDCYFYIDESIPVQRRGMSVICVPCQVQHKIPAWFWEGSQQGYGPFDYICCKCGHVVHKGQDDEETETEDDEAQTAD